MNKPVRVILLDDADEEYKEFWLVYKELKKKEVINNSTGDFTIPPEKAEEK